MSCYTTIQPTSPIPRRRSDGLLRKEERMFLKTANVTDAGSLGPEGFPPLGLPVSPEDLARLPSRDRGPRPPGQELPELRAGQPERPGPAALPRRPRLLRAFPVTLRRERPSPRLPELPVLQRGLRPAQGEVVPPCGALYREGVLPPDLVHQRALAPQRLLRGLRPGLRPDLVLALLVRGHRRLDLPLDVGPLLLQVGLQHLALGLKLGGPRRLRGQLGPHALELRQQGGRPSLRVVAQAPRPLHPLLHRLGELFAPALKVPHRGQAGLLGLPLPLRRRPVPLLRLTRRPEEVLLPAPRPPLQILVLRLELLDLLPHAVDHLLGGLGLGPHLGRGAPHLALLRDHADHGVRGLARRPRRRLARLGGRGHPQLELLPRGLVRLLHQRGRSGVVVLPLPAQLGLQLGDPPPRQPRLSVRGRLLLPPLRRGCLCYGALGFPPRNEVGPLDLLLQGARPGHRLVLLLAQSLDLALQALPLRPELGVLLL
mmetsp:Transcript_2486/g.8446  ORF Transcript_2486/g.8446 Transcript_2486/m.8446 type:complete len:485 (+) Transcript_2486:1092-2546(+)